MTVLTSVPPLSPQAWLRGGRDWLAQDHAVATSITGQMAELRALARWCGVGINPTTWVSWRGLGMSDLVLALPAEVSTGRLCW